MAWVYRRLFILLLFCYLAYALTFIWQTGFVVDSQRCYSLLDDEMISMRYARNLVAGWGCVWNPGGEHVEGFTNPLWVLYMALLHLLPVAMEQISLLVQVTGALLLSINLWVVKKLAEAVFPEQAAVGLVAALAAATYFPLNRWSWFGVEVSILTLLVTLAVWAAVRTMQTGRFSAWPYVLLGVAMLVRIDMLLPFACISIFLVRCDRNNRKAHLWGALVTGMLCLGLPAVARWWYFGDLLPNTYYLKMTGASLGVRLAKGAYVVAEFVARSNWLLVLLPLTLLASKRSRPEMLLLAVFWLQIAYNFWVGGDAWEPPWTSRFVCIVMPLFFILFAGVVLRLPAVLLPGVALRPGFAACMVSLFLVLSIINFNIGDHLPYSKECLLLTRPSDSSDHELYVKVAHLLKAFTNQKARVAVVWAGVVPYFAERECVDMLGKNDRKIAHGPFRPLSEPDEMLPFRAGHNKWDYAYSIGQLKPDVVIQLWKGRDEAYRSLKGDYVPVSFANYEPFFLRRGSPNIKWDLLVHEKGKLDRMLTP
jgi:arabinofuranosyltransferase